MRVLTGGAELGEETFLDLLLTTDVCLHRGSHPVPLGARTGHVVLTGPAHVDDRVPGVTTMVVRPHSDQQRLGSHQLDLPILPNNEPDPVSGSNAKGATNRGRDDHPA